MAHPVVINLSATRNMNPELLYRSIAVPSQLDQVGVEITVLLGRALMPMQQLLRMGRGAVIQLDTKEDDQVWILANNHPIARGELVIENDKISVNITRPAEVADFYAVEQ
jgi:flagellar motor switch protein FliN/FliY